MRVLEWIIDVLHRLDGSRSRDDEIELPVDGLLASR